MRNLFGIPLPERKGMKKGGSAIPRNTVIANEPHHLAYINEEEDKMLRDAGGSGQPGPGGVPAFAWYNPSTWGDTTTADTSNDDDEPGFFESGGAFETWVDTNIYDFDGDQSIDTSNETFISGGGADGVGEYGVVGDFFGGITDALNITDYSGGDNEITTSLTTNPNVTSFKGFVDDGFGGKIYGTQDLDGTITYYPNGDADGDGRMSDEEKTAAAQSGLGFPTLKDATDYLGYSGDDTALIDFANATNVGEPIDSAAVIQDLEERGITSDWELADGEKSTEGMSPEQITSALDNYVGDSQLTDAASVFGVPNLDTDDDRLGETLFSSTSEAPVVDSVTNANVSTNPVTGNLEGSTEIDFITNSGGDNANVGIDPDTGETKTSGDGLVSGGISEENSGSPLGAVDWVNDAIDEGYDNAMTAGPDGTSLVSAETDPANSDKNGLLNQVANMPGYVGAAGQFIGGLLQSLGGTDPSDKLVTTVDGKQVFEKAGGGYYAVNAVGLPFDIEGGGSDGKGIPTSISMSGDSGAGFNESDDNEVTLETVGEVDEVSCPEGHVYDSAQEMCVLDPFQQEWGEADYDAAADSVSPTNVYTEATVPENAFKALQPGIIDQSPAFVLPTLNTTAADLTVGTQATDPIPGAGEATDPILGAHVMPDDWRTRPIGSQAGDLRTRNTEAINPIDRAAGLAALNLDPRLASNMRETQTDMTNRFSNNASFLG